LIKSPQLKYFSADIGIDEIGQAGIFDVTRSDHNSVTEISAVSHAAVSHVTAISHSPFLRYEYVWRRKQYKNSRNSAVRI